MLFAKVALAFAGFSPAKIIEKIGFHFYKVSLRQFVRRLSFYAIFNCENWLFLNSSEFELRSVY